MAVLPTAENVKLPGAVGMGGVKPYVLPVVRLVVMFASVVELTLVPALFTDKKFPDPVAIAVIPIDADGELAAKASDR
jgi:hypothetical protein